MGSFVFRWPYPANDVHVTGTFDDWGKSIKLEKVGNHWEKEVELPSADEKVYYKFIVDDEWIVDKRAPTEGDGHYNTNNVLYPIHIKRKDDDATTKANDIPGAFPGTPAQEAPSFGISPFPASSGAGNPINLPAGTPVAGQKNDTARGVDSAVTTSKEDYEKAGSSAFPLPDKQDAEYSVDPIPGTSGAGNPISVPAGSALPDQKDVTSDTLDSNVTTSKEDYEKAGTSTAIPESKADEPAFGVQPIPASSGIGNPISVPAGSKLPDQKDATSNTVGSTVTTSKEDYEKAGSSTAIPGSKADEPAFGIQPIPASSGVGNPISVPAGAALPDQKDVTSNTVNSSTTTSKEDYERAGSSAAVPESDADEPAFGVQPIPASSGIGNPVSLPAGAPVPDQKNVTPHTVDSTVTTSKEDYEKAGSSAFPSNVAAGAGAAGAVLGGAALGSAFSVPKEKTNLIPESSLPMGSGKTDTLDAGPFISSSGPGTTTADLASKVPLETNPIISSSGPGTTTANLASDVPLEKEGFSSTIGADRKTSQLASELEVPLKHSPFISSSGPGTTTSELASQAPLQNDPTIRSSGPGTTTADLTAQVPLQDDPTIRSSGPGTTTSALAAGVPLEDKNVPRVVKESISTAHQDPEAAASPEAVKDKAELEKELLSRTKTSEATGEPASAATHQTSYYGLATSVPQTVEKSMQQAHAAPEAAAESSAVAGKSAMEQELLSKIPSTEEAGEPAPTFSAATITTAPTATSAEAVASSVTDGNTANQPVPDTDTSSAARGVSAGELAGGVAVGGAAAAGAATLAARHHDADIEPPRISDSQKPDITTEASPATAVTNHTPGQSKSAAAAVSDGAADTPTTEVPRSTAPIEASEGATTEYAPVRTSAIAPGVSSSAGAALSDGTEDPNLADEPAVKMMRQNEGTITGSSAPTTTSTTVPATDISSTIPTTTGSSAKDETSTAPAHDATTIDPASTTGVSTSTTNHLTSTAPVHDATTTDQTSTSEGPYSTTKDPASTTLSTAPVHDATTTAKDSTTGPSPSTATPIAPVSASSAAATASSATGPNSATADASTLGNKDPSAIVSAAGVPSLTSAGTDVSKVAEKKHTEPQSTAPVSTGVTSSATQAVAEKKDVGPSTTTTGSVQAGTPSTPVKKTTPTQDSAVNSPVSRSDSTNTDRRKKRHRISAFFHKIADKLQ